MSPIRVDFYLLTATDDASYWTLVCRLIDKAYAAQQHVWVYCAQLAQCDHLDEYLWAYEDTAFIPHACLNDPLASEAPVCITTPDSPLRAHVNLLINLSAQSIEHTGQLTRIIEIIPPEDAAKAAARERFRTYRQRGFVMHTHTI
jgi:DNA polymerase-3 subunit chi